MNSEAKMKLPFTITVMGAIVAIMSMFIAWFSMMGIMTISGFDLAMHAGEINDTFKASGTFAYYIPLIVMILAIIAAIVAALPMFNVKIVPLAVYGILTLIGVVSLILLIVYSGTNLEYQTISLGSCLGTGFYLGAISALATSLVGAFGLAGKFNE